MDTYCTVSQGWPQLPQLAHEAVTPSQQVEFPLLICAFGRSVSLGSQVVVEGFSTCPAL